MKRHVSYVYNALIARCDTWSCQLQWKLQNTLAMSATGMIIGQLRDQSDVTHAVNGYICDSDVMFRSVKISI